MNQLYSKPLKITAFVINTVFYLFVILAHFITKLNSMFSTTSLSFVVPITIFFSFVIRSIDWRHKQSKGGFVWIIGGILAYASIFVGQFICGMISEITSNEKGVFIFSYWLYIAIGYLIRNLSIFIHQDGEEHFGTPPYDDHGSPNDLSP
ncbi:MAG: hypothetical protein KBS41_03135 [Oscillospiraceae bacterium]|nr:hypothetical protein [Candidatus Equicaccousia limihippi]